MILDMGWPSTSTMRRWAACLKCYHMRIDGYLPMPLLYSPYDIRDAKTLYADNVSLGYLPIAVPYEYSMDI